MRACAGNKYISTKQTGPAKTKKKKMPARVRQGNTVVAFLRDCWEGLLTYLTDQPTERGTDPHKQTDRLTDGQPDEPGGATVTAMAMVTEKGCKHQGPSA